MGLTTNIIFTRTSILDAAMTWAYTLVSHCSYDLLTLLLPSACPTPQNRVSFAAYPVIRCIHRSKRVTKPIISCHVGVALSGQLESYGAHKR